VQKTVLGKGLASLLPQSVNPAMVGNVDLAIKNSSTPNADTSQQNPQINKDRHMGISMVLIDDIVVNPFQPRREFDDEKINELSQSIKEHGIIQPLVVTKTMKGYQLIAGERRLRAAKNAGLKMVPIVIRKSTDLENLELALIENIQRQDLNCIDEALGYFQLQEEFRLTHEEIAKKVGKDRATISNCLRLLKLPEVIIEDLKQGKLSLGHGKVLLGVQGIEAQLQIRTKILEKNLSVRQLELLIKEKEEARLKGDEAPATLTGLSQNEQAIEKRFQSISRDLTQKLSTRVEIKGKEKKGKIVIHYRNRADLDLVLEKLNKIL